jgi:hypothetical protein
VEAVGKRPLGRPRCRWENNVKMDLREVVCGGIDWIELRRIRLAGHLARMGKGMYRVWWGRRPLGRPGLRWEDDIKMNLQEVGYGACGLDRAGSG